ATGGGRPPATLESGRIRSDDAKSVVTDEDRRELVRVQPGAAQTVPVQHHGIATVSPLVDEELTGPVRPHSWFRTQTRRTPSSVRNGSILSRVRACGTIRSASPPVATVCASAPSSPGVRWALPPPCPAKP